MTTLQMPPPAAPRMPEVRTVADLLARLDDLPPERVRLQPPPGTATEQDVLDADARKERLCELVDGVLVEKPMGVIESMLALLLGQRIGPFVLQRNLGIVTGPDGMMRLVPGLIRAPDVSFISWDRLPGRKLPEHPIPHLAPDLAVEVLSRTNTKREMQRKLREYFESGVRLVWYVDPAPRTVAVYENGADCVVLTENDTLSGGDVLRDFQLPLREFFSLLDRTGDDPAPAGSVT